MSQAAFFMDSGFSCITNPYAGNLVYWFRANGSAGARPTVSDGGLPHTWRYRDPTKAGLTATTKFWPDYDTSMFFNGSGLLCDPSLGDSNLPFRVFGNKDASWSHMMRIIIPSWNGTRTILKAVGVTSTSWEWTDLQYQLYTDYELTDGTRYVYAAFADATGAPDPNGWAVRTIGSGQRFPNGIPMEILVTRNASTKSTYVFVNGTLIGSFLNGSPRNSYDQAALRVATGGSANSGANKYPENESVFHLNDEYLWNTCIATASYTPSVQPYC